MGMHNNIVIILLISIGLMLRITDGDSIRLPDQVDQNIQQPQTQTQPQQQQQPVDIEGRRQGKHLLDFVGLGTGANVDPFLAKVNANCLSGELSECFKSQALGAFTDFFNKPEYLLSENARVVRVSDYEMRSLEQEPFEYSTEPRADESEWDQLVKFALRKVERFLKSATIEVQIPNEISESGRYSPRFITDEISDEIDIIEDKHAGLYGKHKLKKLFIPMLIILKLFKLKLLLFLPLILGLASFKKLLGFLAIIIPGVIGYFRLCRPQQNPFGNNGFGNQYNAGGFPQYSPQGVGLTGYNHVHYDNTQVYEPNFSKPYGDYYGKSQQIDNNNSNIRFGENNAQNLAYQGYSQQYRSNNNVEQKS